MKQLVMLKCGWGRS